MADSNVEPVCEPCADQDVEEAAGPKPLLHPLLPSPGEVAAHRADHFPYRPCCKHCIGGRARREQHRLRQSHLYALITGVYYFFPTANGLQSKDELRKENHDAEGMVGLDKAVKCLVVKDYKSKVVVGHPVPGEGCVDEGCAAGTVVRDVKWLGCTDMVFQIG